MTGAGKRSCTANARLPFKVLWMRRAHVLRRLLHRMSDALRLVVSLKLQKRVAASVLKCGKRQIWLDPNEIN